MKPSVKYLSVLFILLSFQSMLFAARSLDEIANENKKFPVHEDSDSESKTNYNNVYDSSSLSFTEYDDIQEEIIGLIEPFQEENLGANELMKADPKNINFYETAVNAEKNPNVFRNPQQAIKAWINVKKNPKKNPFLKIAEKRLVQWAEYTDKLDNYKESLQKVKQLVASSVVSASQKKEVILSHFEEFGIAFGTQEVLNIINLANNPELNKTLAQPDFQQAVKTIKSRRCDLGSGKDCFDYGQLSPEENRMAFIEKSCSLNYKLACDKKAEIAKQVEAEKKRKDEEERRKLEEEKRKEQEAIRKAEAEKRRKDEEERRKLEKQKWEIQYEQEMSIKQELNAAGRKKRLGIATGLLVPGIVFIAGGGVALYEMQDSQKWHDYYYEKYLDAYYSEDIDHYRKKTQKFGNQVTAFKILGALGIGVGGAMLISSIVLYSIDFPGEKAVKRKYNLSFGASPADGSVRLTLNW